MTRVNDVFPMHGRDRRMRPDAYRWIRHDVHRWMRLDAAISLPESPVSDAKVGRAAELRVDEATLAQLGDSLDDIRTALADLKFHLTFRRLLRKYSPDQPRVPVGSPDGGQWTSGGGARVLVADNARA